MKLHLPVALLRAVMALFATTTTFTSAWAQDAAPADVTYSVNSHVIYGSGEGKTPWEGQESTWGLEDVYNVTFTSDSEKLYSVTFDGTDGAFDGEKDAGYTAIVGDNVTFEKLDEIKFTDFEDDSYALHSEYLTVQNNNKFFVVDNNNQIKRITGTQNTGGSTIFSGCITLSDNAQIVMSRNKSESYVDYREDGSIYSGYTLSGGVIYSSFSNGLDGQESVSVLRNKEVTFSDNKLDAQAYEAYGAVIYADGSVSFEDNTKVAFTRNTAESHYMDISDPDSYNPSSYHANAAGGAIYSNYWSDGETDRIGVALIENGDVEFSNNTAIAGNDASGGAIHNQGSETLLSGNDSIAFSQNKAESKRDGIVQGGAIYSYGKLSIVGNGDVLFDGNTISTVGGNALGSAISVGNDITDSNSGVVVSENTGAITVSNNGVTVYGEYYDINGNYCSGGVLSAGAVVSTTTLAILQNAGVITFAGNYINNIAGTADELFDFIGSDSSNGSGLIAGAAIATAGPVVIGYNLSDVVFNGNTLTAQCASVFGGAMVNVMGDITFAANQGKIEFTGNSASTTTAQGYAWGGAVSTCASLADTLVSGITVQSSVVFDGNKDISFSGNSVSAQFGMANGGAIYSSNDVTLVNNGDISFGGGIQEEDAVVAQEQEPAQNAAGNTAQGYYANGGAIYSEGDVTLGYVDEDGTGYGNGSVEFVGNSAVSSVAHASGGAIFAGGNVTVSGNDGVVKFNENKVQSGGSSVEGSAITAAGNVDISGNEAGVEIKDNSAEGYYNAMGAVYAANAINVQNNGGVTIEGNSATEKSNETGIFSAASGGGLNAGLSLNVSGNEDVVVKDNSVSSANGYAIAGGVGAMVVYLDGNKSLTFETNTAVASQYAGGGAILSTGILAIRGQEGDVSFIGNNATSLSGVARGGAITADLTPGADAIWSRIDEWQKSNPDEVVPESLFDDMPEDLQPLLAKCNSPEDVKAVLSTVVPNSVAIAGNGAVSFTNNSAVSGELNENGAVVSRGDDASGGAIYSNGDVILSANESLKFGGVDGDSNSLGNVALSYGGSSNGGAIAAEGDVTIGRYGEGDDMLPGNGSVEFSNNSATSYGDGAKGGAIYSSGNVLIAGNTGGVSFNANTAESFDVLYDDGYIYNYHDDAARGGAIYSEGNLELSHNGDVAFGSVIGEGENAKYENGNIVQGEEAHGGAVYSKGDVTLSNNSSVSFYGNALKPTDGDAFGGAIYSAKSVSIENNTNGVNFSGNSITCNEDDDGFGGAIYAGLNSGSSYANADFGHDVTLRDNGNVTFADNKIVSEFRARGGAIYADGYITLSGNGDVTFSGNSVKSDDGGSAIGGAISTYLMMGDDGKDPDNYATIPVGVTLSGNKEITFAGNSATSGRATANGGAIYSAGKVEMTGNSGNILFSGNSNEALSAYSACGGAIAGFNGVVISGNTGEIIRFENNLNKSNGGFSGAGAVYSSYDDVSIVDNVGVDIEFSNNSVEGIGKYQILGSDEVTITDSGEIIIGGGAIGSDGSSVNIKNNGLVSFDGNSVIDKDGTAPIPSIKVDSVENTIGISATGGGAVMALQNVEICNNEGVSIKGNSSSSDSRLSMGGAIVALGRVSISHNKGDVNVSGNYAASKTGDAIGGAILAQNGLSIVNNEGDVTFSGNYVQKGDTHTLNSVVVQGGKVELAAVDGKSISFYDTVMVGAGEALKLNSYTDAQGNTQTSTGAIVFSGANVVETLQQLKGEGNVSDNEISTSLTSQIYRNVSVEAGSLQVKDGAVLEMLGLDVKGGAELLIGAGSTVAVGSAVTFESGSEFTVKGLEAAATMSVAESASSTPAAAQIVGNVELAAGMTYTMDGAYTALVGTNDTLTLDKAGGYTFNVDESLAYTDGNTKYFVLFTGVEHLAGVDSSALTGIEFLTNIGYYDDIMLNYIDTNTTEYGGVLYISATVPEPTTATLSLLALAALAARRRRR